MKFIEIDIIKKIGDCLTIICYLLFRIARGRQNWGPKSTDTPTVTVQWFWFIRGWGWHHWGRHHHEHLIWGGRGGGWGWPGKRRNYRYSQRSLHGRPRRRCTSPCGQGYTEPGGGGCGSGHGETIGGEQGLQSYCVDILCGAVLCEICSSGRISVLKRRYHSNINVTRIFNYAQAQTVLQINWSSKVAGHFFYLYILPKNETLRGLWLYKYFIRDLSYSACILLVPILFKGEGISDVFGLQESGCPRFVFFLVTYYNV